MPEHTATKLKDRIAENRQQTQQYRDIANSFLYFMSDLDQHECPITIIEDDRIEDDLFSATQSVVSCRNAIVLSAEYGARWVSHHGGTTQQNIDVFGAYAVMYYHRIWSGEGRRSIATHLLREPEFKTEFNQYIHVSLLTNPVSSNQTIRDY